jgi:hypothetical protein
MRETRKNARALRRNLQNKLNHLLLILLPKKKNIKLQKDIHKHAWGGMLTYEAVLFSRIGLFSGC